MTSWQSKAPAITLVIKDYDYIAPLACGDVEPEGIQLRLERDTPRALDRTLNDPTVDAGEVSFCRYLLQRAGAARALAHDDLSLVGIPFFAYRAFRHRCFFVRRESDLRDLGQLAGKRVGTNEWPASGNVWTRALLREQGVSLSGIQWFIGPVDNPNTPQRPQGTLPSYAHSISQGQTLLGMLLDGELDALMCPVPPAGFSEPDSSVIRLITNYREAERDYYQRIGIYPPHHIIGIRRQIFDRHPWVARSLYDALERSRLVWHERRRAWAESSPWFLAELEEVTALMGHDWQPNGYIANSGAIQAFCDELVAQELIAQPLDGAMVFAEFQQVMNG